LLKEIAVVNSTTNERYFKMLIRDLTKVVAGKLEVTEGEAAKMVQATLDGIINALKAGEEVNLNNFGKFTVKVRPAHQARNPRTGATVEVPEKKNITYRTTWKIRTEL
jgi:DNA-binding protein HU-beta